jgi:hypothetical protein
MCWCPLLDLKFVEAITSLPENNDVVMYPFCKSNSVCSTYKDNHLSFHALYTFQEGTVKNNRDGGTIDDTESVIKQLKDENSSLKER